MEKDEEMEMTDAEQELENLSNEDLVLMCSDAFENIRTEENPEELCNEIETLFIPQLRQRLNSREVKQNIELFINMQKNLGKCFTFLQNFTTAIVCWEELLQFLHSLPKHSDKFSPQQNKLDCEISGVYVNIGSLHQLNGDHKSSISSYQKAMDILMPWIVEAGDVSPVPNLLSIATRRVSSCVAEKEWKVLKDDIQTVASVRDIIDQLKEMCNNQFDLGLNTLIFEIEQYQNGFVSSVKSQVNTDTLVNILQNYPEVNIDEDDAVWIRSQFSL